MRDVLPNTIIDGRYKVESRIGSGGMADVYCATDQQLGRRVALKVLYRRFAADQEFVERFRREASSAAGLQHPNVVSVYDRGEWDGTYYIAMEYLDGRSLKEVIREHGPIDPARAIDLTIQVLKAARFAHKRGIIHRDIKPHNVIVDSEGRAKVTDFGIARAGASDMTETGSIMGTAQYLSPEQAQGHVVSAQSDLYSIGILLYELLTGRVPFQADSAVTIALKQVSEAPLPPSQFNTLVSPELEDVVLHALEKDPVDRFVDADAFIAALEAVRAGTAPPPAPRPSTGTRVVGAVTPPPPARRPWWRRWWPWALILLVLAGLAVGGVLLADALRKEPLRAPNVVGRDASAASAILGNRGLRARLVEVENDRVREGRVIRQDPQPGAEVHKGDEVTLTVSTGPGNGVIPVVEGRSKADATRLLERAGFRVRVREHASDEVDDGKAITTTPGAGETVRRRTIVLLIVSSGPEKVKVPDVVNQARDDAERALRDDNLRVEVREQESEDRDPGTVLAQNPAAGTEVDKNSTVTLTVAKEPSRVEVPDVVGKSRDDAVEAITRAGLEPRVRSVDVDTPDDDEKVVKQSPAGGQKRTKGSRVTISIGNFEPPLNPEPTPTPTSEPQETPTP